MPTFKGTANSVVIVELYLFSAHRSYKITNKLIFTGVHVSRCPLATFDPTLRPATPKIGDSLIDVFFIAEHKWDPVPVPKDLGDP